MTPQDSILIRHASLLGWVFLVAGIGAMFASLWLFIIYGPLYLAAFGLAIVSLIRRRILAGICLLAVVLVVPASLWLMLTVYRGADAVDHGIGFIQKKAARSIEESRTRDEQSKASRPQLQPLVDPQVPDKLPEQDKEADQQRQQ